MLPPLVMNIKSHHIIFDMCAAPGSKSAQIVELLHSDAEDSAGCQSDHLDSNSYVEPSGVLIANDVEQRRCYMMIHQVRRLQSPCVIITQEDATRYPRLYINESVCVCKFLISLLVSFNRICLLLFFYKLGCIRTDFIGRTKCLYIYIY